MMKNLKFEKKYFKKKIISKIELFQKKIISKIKQAGAELGQAQCLA